jgi:hypothetical protein
VVRSLWARRDALADLPVRLCWGLADPILDGSILRTYEAVFDDPSVVPLRGAGHYVQQEVGPDLAPTVRHFAADVRRESVGSVRRRRPAGVGRQRSPPTSGGSRSAAFAADVRRDVEAPRAVATR